MTRFSARTAALSHDVWNCIRRYLTEELKRDVPKNVVGIKCSYDIEDITTLVVYYKDVDKIKHEHFVFINKESLGFFDCLTNAFNLPENIRSLSFQLDIHDIPVFDVKLYPFVSDENLLIPVGINREFLD